MPRHTRYAKSAFICIGAVAGTRQPRRASIATPGASNAYDAAIVRSVGASATEQTEERHLTWRYMSRERPAKTLNPTMVQALLETKEVA